MKVFGQDVSVVCNQLLAMIGNILQWILRICGGKKAVSRKTTSPDSAFVSIDGPGGFDRLNICELPDNKATLGYNVSIFTKGSSLVDISDKSSLPSDLVVVRVHYFSINYADIAIRWGLYESALRFVGWPIVPGFDVSGTVEWAGSDTNFAVGDNVFGFSMFGTYSSRLLVPAKQIRKLPPRITLPQGAAIPAVAATALHALALSGGWPKKPFTSNKAVLIHSAAGGVGSMLIQMCKKVGCYPVVAVVGSPAKADYCKRLGADFVIVKRRDGAPTASASTATDREEDSIIHTTQLWDEARRLCPGGFIAIYDASGVETLQDSYLNLCRCGRVVTYGFHSNLPKSDLLSPLSWLRLIYGLMVMPKFDPMDLVVESKSVMGFNLSFFAEEHELITTYMEQIVSWINDGSIVPPETRIFELHEVADAHACIQSGLSVGKLLVRATKQTNTTTTLTTSGEKTL